MRARNLASLFYATIMAGMMSAGITKVPYRGGSISRGSGGNKKRVSKSLKRRRRKIANESRKRNRR